MSKIKNGGLDQYGTVCGLNSIGGERVNQNETCKGDELSRSRRAVWGRT